MNRLCPSVKLCTLHYSVHIYNLWILNLCTLVCKLQCCGCSFIYISFTVYYIWALFFCINPRRRKQLIKIEQISSPWTLLKKVCRNHSSQYNITNSVYFIVLVRFRCYHNDAFWQLMTLSVIWTKRSVWRKIKHVLYWKKLLFLTCMLYTCIDFTV